jgi:protein ImuA
VQVITCRDGLLQKLPGLGDLPGKSGRMLSSGVPQLDELAPAGGFASGAVHEFLSGRGKVRSFLLPALLARSASQFGPIAWCDLDGDLYPPGLAALGVPINRLMVLRPKTPLDALWAVTECLRCPGIAACIAPVGRINRVQARRLQLAAEQGGGIALLLRSLDAVSWPYAAITRWVINPARGERMIQRCRVELIHGHGGRVGQSVLLEVCRETNLVRSADPMAHRPPAAKTGT